MGTLSDFFNRSKFEAKPLSSNKKDVVLDIEYDLELEIYDVIVMDTPSVVVATLATKTGRTTVALPTVVTTSSYSAFSYLMQFTIATGDWNGTDTLVLQLEITDHNAYVYKLDYQLKA